MATTGDVINALRPLSACFGVCDVIMSDNKYQFALGEFRAFIREWVISHITGSSYYSQSNEAAERTIEAAKQLLRGSLNIEQALTVHCAMLGKEGYAPDELLMEQKVKTNVLATPESL